MVGFRVSPVLRLPLSSTSLSTLVVVDFTRQPIIVYLLRPSVRPSQEIRGPRLLVHYFYDKELEKKISLAPPPPVLSLSM